MKKDITYNEGNIKFNYRVAVVIENYKQNKVLVQQSDNDPNYRLMGGRVSLMEKSSEAAVRELKEELGLEVSKSDIELLNISENLFDYKLDEEIYNVHEMLFIYNLQLKAENELEDREEIIAHDKENVKFYWIDKGEIENIQLVPNNAKSVIKNKGFSFSSIDDRENS